MTSFTVTEMYSNTKESWTVLRNLWEDILSKDTSWHFMWEPGYILIRCSNSFRSSVAKFFKGRNWPYKIAPWEEPWEVTRKHQDLFGKLFHVFSEMAMQVDDEDFEKVLDRVTHCFINNFHRPSLVNDEVFFECKALAEMLIGRAYTMGKFRERIEASQDKNKS